MHCWRRCCNKHGIRGGLHIAGSLTRLTPLFHQTAVYLPAGEASRARDFAGNRREGCGVALGLSVCTSALSQPEQGRKLLLTYTRVPDDTRPALHLVRDHLAKLFRCIGCWFERALGQALAHVR